MESLSWLAQGSIDFERKEHLWPHGGAIVQQKFSVPDAFFFPPEEENLPRLCSDSQLFKLLMFCSERAVTVSVDSPLR